MTTTNPITLFILENMVLIAYLVIFSVIGLWAFIKFSKYYVLKEVYLAETRGDRRPRLIGRQLMLKSTNSKFAPSSLRDDDTIKAYMVVQDGFPGSTKKIAIPKGILIKKTPKKTVLANAKGIKHDYDRGYFVPFNEYVEANSPSERVFYDEIDRKLIETNTEVTKAVACSYKTKEWHNMYNSIPIDVEKQKDEKSQVVTIESSEKGDEKEAKKRARKNIERIKRKFSEDDAMDELGGVEL